MRIAALFSGGKDSTFALYLAKKMGHRIECLLTIIPESEESHLLHHSNSKLTRIQAQSLNIPQISLNAQSVKTENEIDCLGKIITKAIKEFKIEGLVHGGISSKFQKERFESLGKQHDLQVLNPIWNYEPMKYMKELLDNNFEFLVTSVSSNGLDDSWLGKLITMDDLKVLSNLSKKYGFNLTFEGGEAETFVVNCPLFERPIHIQKGNTIWDGYRGRFEIVEAGF